MTSDVVVAAGKSPLADSAALVRLRAVARVGLGRFPTPLEQLTLRGGAPLFVKRDDQCGFGRGGVKARKIDFFVRHLVERGHDHLVTVATNVTNLVHDLVPLLREHGIGWTIYVTDDPPMLPALRTRLFGDLGDGGVHFIGRSRAGVCARVLATAATLRLRGRRPAMALPSLGHPASILGVARGFLEMMEQMQHQAASLPRTVFITAASGVTLAGLAFGAHLLADAGVPRVSIVAVPVYSGPVRAYAKLLLGWAGRCLGVRRASELEGVSFTDWREGGDFGRFGPRLTMLCERVHAEHGLELDPIYGAKTWAVMERLVAGGAAAAPRVYWHCGYTPDWRELPPSDGCAEPPR